MSKLRQDMQQQLERDEVAESLQKIQDKLRRNKNTLIAALVLIIAAIVITTAVRGHRARVLADTNRELDSIINKYLALQNATDDKQREDQLKALGTSASTLIDTYGGTGLAREARFIQGAAYYELDKFKEAQKAFDDYLKQAQTPEEKARGQISLAYTLENQSFFENPQSQANLLTQALNQYSLAAIAAKGEGAQPAQPYLYYYALLGQARIQELTLHNAEAIKIYEQILKDRPYPVEQKADPQTAREGDMMLQMMREQVDKQFLVASFQSTAKLRLEQLKAAGGGPAQTTASATAPSAAATPAATATTAAPAPGAPSAAGPPAAKP